MRRRAEPCVLVIFGASGDLTQRKLMPALYALAVRHLLPERFVIVGAARTQARRRLSASRCARRSIHYARDAFSRAGWESSRRGCAT